MADIFDVISDSTRRDLLGMLLSQRVADTAEGDEMSVGQLVEATGLSQPTVSKHLKVLRDHGLVSVREEAQHRYYRLETAPLAELEDWLVPFLVAQEYPMPSEGNDDSSTPFFAWSGADVGESIGRKAATGAHLASEVVHTVQDAASRAGSALHEVTEQVARRLPKPLQVGPFRSDEEAEDPAEAAPSKD